MESDGRLEIELVKELVVGKVTAFGLESRLFFSVSLSPTMKTTTTGRRNDDAPICTTRRYAILTRRRVLVVILELFILFYVDVYNFATKLEECYKFRSFLAT
jgi:hypothetical protein